MQVNSNIPTYSKQLILPIEFAPRKVRAHGLKDAHSYPLVSQGKGRDGAHRGSYRVPVEDAWDYPEIELRAANSWSSIVLDVDGANALYRIVEAVEKEEIKSPCWLVTSKCSGGTHAVWNLERPVHRGGKARQGPLNSLALVSEFYAATLKADPRYTGVLSHNPMSKAHGPDFVTNWLHREAYTLPQLGEVIPLGWNKPRIKQTGIGRNCDLFESLMAWAGRPENQGNNCLAAAHVINQSFDTRLDYGEVAATARSVNRYRARWIAKGEYFTQEQRSQWGRVRQAKGVSNRRGRSRDRNRSISESSESNAALSALHGLSVRTIQRIRR